MCHQDALGSTHCVRASPAPGNPLLTAVGVNEFGFREADPEVVEHRGLVEVAEGRQVILTHQDVRVPERRQRFRINRIIQLLCTKIHLKLWKRKMLGVSAGPPSLSSLPPFRVTSDILKPSLCRATRNLSSWLASKKWEPGDWVLAVCPRTSHSPSRGLSSLICEKTGCTRSGPSPPVLPQVPYSYVV